MLGGGGSWAFCFVEVFVMPKLSDDVWFDKLTSPEVDALDRERTVLVLPAGCTEQQGPHLPLDVDTFLVTLFLSEAARRARAEGIVAYLLPALPYGPAEEHMAFPGTVSISFETHHRIVKEVLRSLARHGFQRLLVAMGCGGHHCLPAAMEARAELRREGVRAGIWCVGPGGAYYEIARRVFEWEPADIHAGEFPTSIFLLERPDDVRRERLAAGRPFDANAVPDAWFSEEVDPQGFAGDPRRAGAELGRLLLEEVVAYWVGQLRRVARAPGPA
jgi:creatinine amidohydrolase